MSRLHWLPGEFTTADISTGSYTHTYGPMVKAPLSTTLTPGELMQQHDERYPCPIESTEFQLFNSGASKTQRLGFNAPPCEHALFRFMAKTDRNPRDPLTSLAAKIFPGGGNSTPTDPGLLVGWFKPEDQDVYVWLSFFFMEWEWAGGYAELQLDVTVPSGDDPGIYFNRGYPVFIVKTPRRLEGEMEY